MYAAFSINDDDNLAIQRDFPRISRIIAHTGHHSSRSIFVPEPPFDGLEATYTIHLKLAAKLVVDFLFMIELFC